MTHNPPKQPETALENPQMPLSDTPVAELETTILKDDLTPKDVSRMPSWRELKGEPQFRLGIVIDCISVVDPQICALSKPVSSCTVISLVILNPDANPSESIKAWVENNRLKEKLDDIDVSYGQTGFQKMLKSNLDAVFFHIQPGSQREYVLAALESGKHVLLNDPVSTSLAEFKEQQEVAKKHGKFIQFSTMFVHQYRVRRFIERVLADNKFGRIHSIDAFVRLNYDDVEAVGVKLPLGPHSGSIRVLGRYCVLVSALFFSRVGSYACSAKVESVQLSDNGESRSAICTVNFTEGRQLKFDVGYTHSATRQSIELQADNRYAQMKDFIIEHPDGLATYRVYDRAPLPTGAMAVVSGEAIDVSGCPPQNTMMWRSFVQLCHSLDLHGGWDGSDQTAQCRELANVAYQTKRILLALIKSWKIGFKEVVIDDIDYE